MLVLVSVLVYLCVPWTAAQVLDLYEGDVCKQVGRAIWTCKRPEDCPKAKDKLTNGSRPEICSFSGSDVIVCCEPEGPPPATTIKSKEMCKKYAESVFIKIEDPLGDGYSDFDTCANVEPLITNGVDAQAREYPHMALVGYGPKESIDWLCAGTLISERFILSAAHCTDAGRKGLSRWIRLGEYNIKTTKDEVLGLSEPKEYEIIERFVHPDYNSRSVYNDIALYKLNKDVEFNEYIRPICLQTDHQFPKTYAIATGWGRTEFAGQGSDVLQKVNLTLIPGKVCNDAYKEISGTPRLKNGIADRSMVCAGDIINKKDTCQGDSGGPLQLRLKNPYCMYSQVGITSFGYKCASNKPGVYTRVSAFVPWIESVVWP